MNYEEILGRWQNSELNDSQDIHEKLSNFKVNFAYHSGKFENSNLDYYDFQEIFKSDRILNYTGSISFLFEKQNQKDCFELIEPSIAKKVPISIELVKRIHFELMKGTSEYRKMKITEKPGEFKKENSDIGIFNIGSTPYEVEIDLKDLLNEVNSYQGNNIIKVGAYFHAKFEQIRPFSSGNGKVGRVILNYFLMVNNHPPIIIFEEDKRYYNRALESFDNNEKIEPLIGFLKNQLIKTWHKKSKSRQNYSEE